MERADLSRGNAVPGATVAIIAPLASTENLRSEPESGDFTSL